MKGTTNPLTPDQNIVFKKLLEIRGPKIYTDTYTAR